MRPLLFSVVALSLLAVAAPARAEDDQAADDEQPATTTPPTSSAQPVEATPPPPAVPVVTSPSPAPVDQPTVAEPTPKAQPKPRPFAGSALYTTNSMTTGTVFRGQQLTHNPTVESTLWILPRYAFNDAWQLRGRMIVAYEYTNSDTSTYRNEPILSDTTLQLFYRKIPKLAGIQPALALNMGLPTSKLSRARTLVVNPGVTLQLSRPIEHFLGGEAGLLSAITYSHPFYRSENPEVVGSRPPNAFACVGGNNCQDLLSGTMNPSNTLAYLFLFEVEWGKWNPALYYLGASQWVYSPPEAVNPVDGRPIERPPGFEPTAVRQTHYVSAWLDYNFNTWFTGEVGFWNSVSSLNNAGERSNLIFDRYQDTRVYLGASVQLDNLVKVLQGAGEGEAGVVRAKNQKQPMWRF